MNIQHSVKSRAIWVTNRAISYTGAGEVPVWPHKPALHSDRVPVTCRVPALHRHSRCPEQVPATARVPVECRYPARYRNSVVWATPGGVPGTGTPPAPVYEMARFVNQIARDFTLCCVFTPIRLTWRRGPATVGVFRRHGAFAHHLQQDRSSPDAQPQSFHQRRCQAE